MTDMTEKDKTIIKAEVYKAYKELPKKCPPNTKLVMALKIGLERAQKRIDNEEKKESR